MKYIDAEKLKAEIERQKKTDGWCEVGKDTADVYYARGFRFACDNLISFIDSLQQEESDKSLTETAEEYVYSWCKKGNEEVRELFPKAVYRAFIAGAKWQADHAPLPEDTVLFQKGVEEGRRLEMEDIMKDTVECSVYAGKEGGKWIVSYIGNYESILKTCKGGDKVRIIIVKKDNHE